MFRYAIFVLTVCASCTVFPLVASFYLIFFFFSSRRRHTRYIGDWSSDVCSSDLRADRLRGRRAPPPLTRRGRGVDRGSPPTDRRCGHHGSTDGRLWRRRGGDRRRDRKSVV